ncbi:hypothetical protein PDIG_11230 [Penicillium digitatum PHI26]|uniref:Uncharacterized protein n=2 Tax=Penicillium digitatum TaxID=36651 RepID=K9G8B3_PEND2|nr:hypothetical protein PDIP_82730 [Penicillium digitatum Pd1]EKV05519.1 hypothetical protein PDIP_82730 [Penicillium digitatum Pd1]EKV18175.1 hypothetical protein PDIG_11230 [Penicillium digitatum PHI26]
MQPFEHNVNFSSVDLTKVGKFKPQLMKRLLGDVGRLLSERSVHPVRPLSVYRISEIEKAFRTLQNGKSMGKIVVVPHEGDQVKVNKNTMSGFRCSSLIVHVSGRGSQDQSNSLTT